MRDTTAAASYAIQITRRREQEEIGPDELLLGCLQSLARFGVAQLGAWTFDLETLGIHWLEESVRGGGPKPAYSDATVAIFDLAGRIARADHATEIRIEHLLAAFAGEEGGLMGTLKRDLRIDSAAWRGAAASLTEPVGVAAERVAETATARQGKDYLSPEEAAEALGIHVQTLRTYVRTGKLPAFRLAGERALRIRRIDLETVLEPLVPEKQ